MNKLTRRGAKKSYLKWEKRDSSSWSGAPPKAPVGGLPAAPLTLRKANISIRNECLDYFIIFTEGRLRKIVKGYVDYYNNYQPHQGLKGMPNGPPELLSKTGKIKQKPLLFGLHNHYYREAA
jgi:hypothetical protein